MMYEDFEMVVQLDNAAQVDVSVGKTVGRWVGSREVSEVVS